jgi:hypothetical protein
VNSQTGEPEASAPSRCGITVAALGMPIDAQRLRFAAQEPHSGTGSEEKGYTAAVTCVLERKGEVALDSCRRASTLCYTSEPR